jgi:hypothetical protein
LDNGRSHDSRNLEKDSAREEKLYLARNDDPAVFGVAVLGDLLKGEELSHGGDRACRGLSRGRVKDRSIDWSKNRVYGCMYVCMCVCGCV